MRALLLLAATAAVANAVSITWTGIAEDNQWFNHINWSPAQVPGPNDDVSIPSGVVQVTAPTGCNSLQMGTLVEAPANLTLFQMFTVGNGGMVVEGNGNLIINTGLQMVFGQVTIAGYLKFIDGVLGGQWTVTSRAAANLGNANEKGFSGCQFISKGTLSLGGVVQLNQSSSFSLQSNTASNTDLIIQAGDSTTVVFDASAASFTYSTGTLTIQAPVLLGAFTLVSGNISILDSLTFTQALNVPANSYVSAVGNAVLNASTGFTGAGVVSVACKSATLGAVSMTGFVNAVGGDVLFTSASSIGVLTISGGNVVFMADVKATQLNMISGTTAGTGNAIGTNVLVSTKGFSLGSPIVANTTATFQQSILAFGTTASFKIDVGCKATATGSLLLTGPPNVPGVMNHGSFDAQAAVSSQNIDIKGAGTWTVKNKLTVGSATFSQKAVTLSDSSSFSGSNTFLTLGKVASSSGGMVDAVLGDYHFSCPAECDAITTPSPNPPTTNFMFSC
jgi:hypothetical protein